jgi:hypothetical protein
MQKFDADLLAKNLNQLADVFDRKHITAPALQAWFDTLRDFPTERVMSVLLGWPKTHGKFPTPADVWKVCGEIGSAEIERKAALDKRPIEWERSPQGAKFLAKMKAIINKPGRTPQQQWEHVLATQKPGDIGYEYAKKALKRIDREPGSDDERAVNF